MKTLFIPARINLKVDKRKIESFSLRLPKSLAIAYSVQYKETADKIREILSKSHKITSFIQVLGCSRPSFPKSTEAIILVSSGRFHAVSLAFESNLPVYVLEYDKLTRIKEEDISSFRKKKLASYARFLHANKIGIVVSTKPGQEAMKRVLALKNKLKNKDSYIFMCNDINIKEFENFPEIQSWVNTACPRLDFDSSFINIADLEKN